MTSFTTGGSVASFTTSGSTTTFTVTPAVSSFTAGGVYTPTAHASSHGAGGSDPITTLGTVAFNAGAAATPTVTFTGDPNTGIYSPGADQVAITTAGTARIVLDSAGKVAFGTATPLDRWTFYAATSADLLVVGDSGTNATIELNSGNSNPPRINLRKSRGTNASKSIVSTSDTVGLLAFQGYDGTVERELANIQATVDGTPGSDDMPGALRFFTRPDGAAASATERMVIDSTGLITGSGPSLGSWTAYTPTVTSGSGSFTSVTGTGRYCRVGKTVHVVFTVAITTNGSAATVTYVTLPFAVANQGQYASGTGRENAATGFLLQVYVPPNTSTAAVQKYDGTYVGADGYSLGCSVAYEIA